MDISIITYNIHGLPWIRCPVVAIATWIVERSPDIVCIQEIFQDADRDTMKRCLEAGGYTVQIPMDFIPACLSSGLLTAVRSQRFTLHNSIFQPFFHNFLEDTFANKGFHILTLYDPRHNRYFRILNTHLQSNVELSCIIGTKIVCAVRNNQAAQILDYVGRDAGAPSLLVGDLNTHKDPHRYLRILHPLAKITFPATGENLDHVAWMPLEWAGTCGYCAIHGPLSVGCVVHSDIEWSDHLPVEYTIHLPRGPFS
jgi:endonuclease/exonuclease/phosphatase family metal-dependent hydrolase